VLGRYPTPVTELTRVASAAGIPAGARLFCKHDDLTGTAYGGNKVRKLEHLLVEAKQRGARRIVTCGAVGSHHVLATAIYGRAQGFEVEAVLAPQLGTPHAEEVARVGASLEYAAFPVRSFAAIPLVLARRLGARGASYLVPPGGSSVTGSLGYVDAAEELAGQIARGELPRPSAIVVALGSGGTAAGLLVGLARSGLLVGSDGAPPVELVAVQVVDAPFASAAQTLSLSLAIRRRLGEPLTRAALARSSAALRIERRFLGQGYGRPTAEGEAATALASLEGLTLDPTYTSKTFAAALAEARRRGQGGSRGASVLFWNTLSAKEPFERLLERAPPLEAIDPKVRALLLRE
jgi:1-aminocyclopropane-1-carboxylate deaminase/D-cysteine desulfhydrase-like pyridoxal-dependent ACC family enzyme